MQVIKNLDDPITDHLVESLIGKYIFVPTNTHTIHDDLENKDEEVNVWFGGLVGGFEKAFVNYDFVKDEFLNQPKIFYHILLTDGMGYVLSSTECEIQEITEEEYAELLAKHQVNQIIDSKLALPGRDF